MTPKKLKAAPARNGAALEAACQFQPTSNRENTPAHLELQARFVSRRTRLPLPLARIVAELAFVGRAA